MDFSKLKLELKDVILIISFVISFTFAYHTSIKDADIRITKIEARQNEYQHTIERIEKRQEEFLSDQKEIQRDIKIILQKVGGK